LANSDIRPLINQAADKRAISALIFYAVVIQDIAGLMGAYGCALDAQARSDGTSTILDAAALQDFTHQVKNINCGLCNNHCRLSVNTFSGGRRYLAGNKCERPVTKRASDSLHNIYKYKQELLASYSHHRGTRSETIGLPLGLNMYELVPFWYRFFAALGFGVTVSPFSSRKLYLHGQGTIPSDTVCFPAKMLHGHIAELIDEKPDAIFYPCMSFNFDEKLGDNHYN
ncbi:MAG: acyl-CoA dehydratase activase-related protein, partial [Clostridiales bacterium]|nr:acyl-CoA dehydratase activase-related protein [Clostridiales bacterium]